MMGGLFEYKYEINEKCILTNLYNEKMLRALIT